MQETEILCQVIIVDEPIHLWKPRQESLEILKQESIRNSKTSIISTTSFKAKFTKSISSMQRLFSFGKPKNRLKTSDATLTTSTDYLSYQHNASAPDIKQLSSSPCMHEHRLSIKSEPSIVQKDSETSLKSFLKEHGSEKVIVTVEMVESVSCSLPNDRVVAQSEPMLNQKITESPRESYVFMQEFLRSSPTEVDPKTTQLQRKLSRSLSREFENRVFETKRVESLDHQRSHTRPIVETHRIYSKKDQRNTIMSPTGQLEVAQGKVNQYHLFETIGTGSFGRVVLARDDVSDELFACKIVSKTRLLKKWRFQSYQKTLGMIRKEVAILKKVSNHPNIIKLYEVLDDAGDDNLYMFLEYCSQGPVMVVSPGQPATPLPEHIALNYFRDIVLGLEYRIFN
jgi:hypothetical protein